MNFRFLKTHCFKPRKILILSEDSSSTIYLPSFLQFFLVVVLIGFSYLVAFTIHSYKNIDKKTASLEGKIKVYRSQNKNLTSEIGTASSYIMYFNKYLSTLDKAQIAKKDMSDVVQKSSYKNTNHLHEQFDALKKKSAQRISYLSRVLFSSGFDNVSDFSKIDFIKNNKSKFYFSKRKKAKNLGGPFEEINDSNFKFEDLSNEDLIKLERIFQAIPRGMPVKAGYISSHFGNRKDPFNHEGAFHGGVDITSVNDKNISSVDVGIVKRLELDNKGYGKFVEIDHGNNVSTLYAHMSKVVVKKGDYVLKNQLIGIEGSTGRAHGSHLHFEIRYKGQKINPIYFITSKNES